MGLLKKWISIVATLAISLFLVSCHAYDDTANKDTNILKEESVSAIEESINSASEEEVQHFANRIVDYYPNGMVSCETLYELTDSGEVIEKVRTEYSYSQDWLLETVVTFKKASNEGEITEKYIYDEYNNLLEYYYCGELKEKYSYDEYGNCISEVTYYSDDSFDNRVEYMYIDGLLAKEYGEYNGYKIIELDSGDTIEIPYLNFYYIEYDEQGRESKVVNYVDEEEPYYFLYTYSENKSICEEYTVLGELVRSWYCEYDNTGRVIKESSFWGVYGYEYEENREICYEYADDEVTVDSISLTEYNDAGLMILEGHYGCDWVPITVNKYKYDKYNKLTEVEITYENGTSETKYGPDRQYTSNGVLIREIFYNDINHIYSN